MATGFFASLLAAMYRDTDDGRRVVGRRLTPFVPPRWFVVSPDDQPHFERRFKQAQVAFFVLVAVAVRVTIDDSALYRSAALALAIIFVLTPFLQLWWSVGLPTYDRDESTIIPVRRAEAQERANRAMGPRYLAGFALLSVLLAVPQAVVAVRDGEWWAWGGVVMFTGFAVYFVRQLALVRAA